MIDGFVNIWSLIPLRQRKRAVLLIAMMVVGMVLEAIGIGLVLPVIGLITQQDLAASFPALQGLMEQVGHLGQKQAVVVAMLALISAYGIKTVFLGLLAWQQMKFAFGLQSNVA